VFDSREEQEQNADDAMRVNFESGSNEIDEMILVVKTS
jgi:hypothetical protein